MGLRTPPRVFEPSGEPYKTSTQKIFHLTAASKRVSNKNPLRVYRGRPQVGCTAKFSFAAKSFPQLSGLLYSWTLKVLLLSKVFFSKPPPVGLTAIASQQRTTTFRRKTEPNPAGQAFPYGPRPNHRRGIRWLGWSGWKWF